MQGRFFVILDKDKNLINRGRISERLTADRFLCYFLLPMPHEEVVPLDGMAGWSFFGTAELLRQYLQSVAPNLSPEKDDGEKEAEKETTGQTKKETDNE